MKVSAPGKLILSGEHAVVYGKPALAFAIDTYATTTITQQNAKAFTLNLTDLGKKHSYDAEALQRLAQHIQHKYARFKEGVLSIREVIADPQDLIAYALATNLTLMSPDVSVGLNIEVTSQLPIGAGVGSSAAIILSVLQALNMLYQKTFNKAQVFQTGLHIENMQHGNSSGLDLHISLHGGCFYYKRGNFSKRQLPDLPMFMVQTGKPNSTTGDCVAAVSKYFTHSNLANEFEMITDHLDKLLFSAGALTEIKKLIQLNHQLLINIGVVPLKIQQFIKEVEAFGDAAKISGAGAITGEQAGIVLVISENAQALQTLCSRYQYSLSPVMVSDRGVHVI